MSINEYVENLAMAAKNSSYIIGNAETKTKNSILHSLIKLIDKETKSIISENEKDVKLGKEKKLSEAMIDRLVLNEKRIKAMEDGLHTIISLPDPVGYVEEKYITETGLEIGKVRVPIGTIGIVFESRPNVTIDAGALCLKSGNAVILRGGSEAFYSNTILTNLIRQALKENSLPEDCVISFDRTDRECVNAMLKLSDYIDVIIPRGGEALIKMVVENSSIPVIKHDKGVCTLYVCADYDKELSASIAINAKVQRPGVCNSIENIIFDKDFPHINYVLSKLSDNGVEIRGDEEILKLYPEAKKATEADWSTEYLDLIISAKSVNGLNEAVKFINTYGSHHSDSILTNDYTRAKEFLRTVDSAAVYVNSSTRFTDGYEFGLGAEIGISTNKLHARGPMGLKELTTLKWIIEGKGHIRN